MRVTIHQPEHFPYLGFFQKMKAADVFVILDSVKYKKNNFQNRNKIQLKSGEDSWITVPVEKGSDFKLIKDVMTAVEQPSNHHRPWREKLVDKVKTNLGVDLTDVYDHEKLMDINMTSIRWCMDKLGIHTEIVYASSLDVDGHKSELLANILRKMGAKTYVSGPSGRDYLDMSFFDGIEVEFFEPKVNNYYSSLYNIVNRIS